MVAHAEGRYMTRVAMPARRRVWRQRVVITNKDDGVRHVFYVEFGEYDDGRLGEVFVTAHRTGTFVRGALDTLAQTVSVALQSGTSPHEIARTLRDQAYPPHGAVEAGGSEVHCCASLADYIAQEIVASYGPDGRSRAAVAAPGANPEGQAAHGSAAQPAQLVTANNPIPEGREASTTPAPPTPVATAAMPPRKMAGQKPSPFAHL